MGYFFLSHDLDLLAFAVVMLGGMGLVHYWLRRNPGHRGFGWKAWLTMLALVVAGVSLAIMSGASEARRVRRTISGLAPTYSQEMALAGLDTITVKTAADDATYLKLIEMEKRWLKANEGVADIYTYGHDAQGRVVLLVDSETDYDRDGKYEGEREQRTAIGEVYTEDGELLAEAFGGQAVFTPDPTSDRWGTWISEYVPVKDGEGKTFAVLGVDFPAEHYIARVLGQRLLMLSLAGTIGLILIGSLSIVSTLRTEMHKREELTRQLVEASRRAGMAEIATGVLHNVGNALNSVNTRTAVLASKMKESGHVGDFVQVVGLINEHQADLPEYLSKDEVGKQMPAFLTALAGALEAQQNELREDVSALFKGVDHIKEIVQSQQRYATSSTVRRQRVPAEVVEEAIALSLGKAGREGVELVRELEAIPAVALDEHKIMAVLVNLLNNAKQATQGVAKPRLIVRLKKQEESLVFEVEDSGHGIAAENMSRIFQHGFTTRADGHGFGLHSAANAAKEMGGAVRVYSEGENRGARFTLEIPLVKEVEVNV